MGLQEGAKEGPEIKNTRNKFVFGVMDGKIEILTKMVCRYFI